MLKYWLQPILRNEYNDDHGGGGYEEDDDLDDDVDDDLFDDEDEDFEEEDDEEDDEPRKKARPGLTVEDLERIAAITRGQPAPAAPQQIQLTPEELDAKLKVFKVTPEFAKDFYDTEEPSERQIAALTKLVSGVTDHMATVMGYANMSVEDRINRTVKPVLDMATRQREQEFTTQMTKAYPVLKGQENVIGHVVNSLRQRGFQPRDGNEAAQVIAGEVEQLLRTANPNFSLSARPRKVRQSSNTRQPMATLKRGGGGGGGGRRNKASKRPAWDEIFD